MSSRLLRDYFPIFSQSKSNNWIYLDSAATSQKLQTVIDVTNKYYQHGAVNVHRSSHHVAASVTAEFEAARKKIQSFIHAKSYKEIVWTKGATESINLVANGLAKYNFKAGDEILVSALEHHANIVPWQQVAEAMSLKLTVMPVDSKGLLLLDDALKLITVNTALVALGHVSNALGNINPVQPIIAKAKEKGALTLIDGTQAVSHISIDVQQLDCDFYVFSGHKMFGPTGIGVLYGKQALLEKLPPYQFGGEMIEKVSFLKSSFQSSPMKFEAGTPNIAGVLGIAAACDFIQQHRSVLVDAEHKLYEQLLLGLVAIPNVRLWGDTEQTICIQSFTVEGASHYDLAVLLDQRNIALRVGHHCAMPLMEVLGIDGTLRVSLAAYNTEDELNRFITELADCVELLLHQNTTPMVQQHLVNTTTPIVCTPIADKIMQAKSWDQTYRQLMLAGKQLIRLDEQYQTLNTEVNGCESKVWLKCSIQNSKVVLEGDSSSKIIRGLLALIFEALEGKSTKQVLDFDLVNYLEKLGLGNHLSESRGNGLLAVFDKITAACQMQ